MYLNFYEQRHNNVTSSRVCDLNVFATIICDFLKGVRGMNTSWIQNELMTLFNNVLASIIVFRIIGMFLNIQYANACFL